MMDELNRSIYVFFGSVEQGRVAWVKDIFETKLLSAQTNCILLFADVCNKVSDVNNRLSIFAQY